VDKRYKLQICRIDGEVRAHLGTYDTPEAIYSSLGGDPKAAVALLDLVPPKTALTTTKELGELVTNHLKSDAVYTNDLMLVRRGEETLRDSDLAVRLSADDELEYSRFGFSFNVASMPMDWIRESLNRDIVFGVFAGHELVSVASLMAWLPQIATIMGVETKPDFRNRGFGSIVVSAVLREALRLSNSCSLFVRQDNGPAQSIYKAMGFKKVGEEVWIDIGTGLVP